MGQTYFTYSNQREKIVYLLPIFNDNYVFIIVNNKNQGLIVDPGESLAVKEFIKKKQIQPIAILVTHSHRDNIGGVQDLLNTFPQLQVINNRNAEVSLKLRENQFHFDVIESPGHIRDHIMFYERNEKWLFCGDVLFRYGCGRIFDGSFEELFSSLGKIKKLPSETMIFCTHEYTLKNLEFCIHHHLITKEKIPELLKEAKIIPTLPFCLAEELKYNPFLKTDNFEEFRKWREQRNHF